MKTYNFCFAIFFCCLLGNSQIIEVPNSDLTFKLDGELNESQWSLARQFSNFKQIQPDLGAPSTENPVVKVVYDKAYVYVGVTVSYKNPNDIYGRTLERDATLSRDDYVEIHLDTYNDNTNTLVFRTNMHAAREDYEVSRNGETRNNSWNTFWDVVTKVSSNKWVAEFRIPFSSLRYQDRKINTMRFKAIVYYKLKNELVISTLNELERTPLAFQYKNSQEVSFQNLPSTNPLYVAPYVKTDILSKNALNDLQNEYVRETEFLQQNNYVKNDAIDKLLSNVGIDIKYKPNSNHIIDFTLNTDFAEVEADDRIINISRFPIFLPEKRLFFLENQDLFNSNQFDHRLFFSRRIGINRGVPVPIIGGVRFTGSNSKWQYGALSLQTNAHLPDNLPSYNMSVVRVKQIVGSKGSYIGVIGTSKVSHNDYNYLGALDGNIRFTDNFRARFTLGSTFDKEKGNWKPVYGIDINTFKSNGFGVNYRFREYHKGFNPELGFVSRPNTKRVTLNNGWRKTYTNHSWLRFISLGNWTTRNWLSSNGDKDFSQSNIYLFLTFKNGLRPGLLGPIYQEDNLTQPWEISENITIPTGSYQMWKLEPSFSTGNAFPYVLNLNSEFGGFYGGSQFTISGNFNYDFSKNFSAEFGGNYNQLKFPNTYVSQGNNLLILSRYYSRLKFSFSSKSFLNSYMQYDTNSNRIGWNLRFRYTPKEGDNLYVVFNQSIHTHRDIVTPKLPFLESQGIIIKYSKTFLR